MIQSMEFDRKADAIYIYFSDRSVAYTKKLDDMRYIDYASDDALIGVELLCVSDGVNIYDLPHSGEIEKLLSDKGVKVLV